MARPPALRRWMRDFGGLGVVVALLGALNLLPPDTALEEVTRTGTIRVCVPSLYPPLVTGDAERPGIDIEILRAVADRMGVGLVLAPNDAIGRDFNPRNWGVTRGHCQMLAGGVVATRLTRSFLDTGPAHATTGWAVVAPRPLPSIAGAEVGTLVMLSGLDRIGLSAHLRAEGVRVRVLRRPEDAVEALAAGRVAAVVTEAMMARDIAARMGWWSGPLDAAGGREDLVFGFWKGDLTLKRAVGRSFDELAREGAIDAILARYGAPGLGS